ncbi:CsiV family protein [Pseudidiomarina sp.]|uniref:CsiV family protein n=1 Tax=Pseudidiomarina sp. TaxID=2081707 RepID=UPI00299DD3B3|nr:CsiV family protein [Pseudidiomarina sp.]MDX1706411.1 CsiV family protein [Pseudidiomarina sp.]
MARFCRLLTAALLATIAGNALAQSDPDKWRWFEVEVLIFRHQANAGPAEEFDWQGPGQVTGTTRDLLTPYYAPDFLSFITATPPCEPDENDLLLQEDSLQWMCHRPEEVEPTQTLDWYKADRLLALLQRAPATVIDGAGGNIQTANRPFLMTAASHELATMRQQLIQRNVGQPLLHVTYRQPVFNRNRNYQFRLYGGRNYGHEFLPSGYEVPDPEDQQIIPANPLPELLKLTEAGELNFSVKPDATPTPPLLLSPRAPGEPFESVWELDGALHIYLVGNYLHIESQLELRDPQLVQFSTTSLAKQATHALVNKGPQRFLRRYKMNQLRRVISHETHYFDHPKLGVIVQIRRTDLSAKR